MNKKIPTIAEIVVDRDPRVFPYGFFASDNAVGIGFISWFKDVDEMMGFLLKVEPVIWDYEDEELENYVNNISNIADKVKSAGLSEDLRTNFNEFVKNDFEIGWWGTFEDLLKDNNEFTQKTREDFIDMEEEGMGDKISEESIAEFIEWLKTFHC
jgi:hypothetical protein